MRFRFTILCLGLLLFAAPVYAAPVFQIGAVSPAQAPNNWPAGEAPGFAIDGVSQKYLNFAKLNTGVAASSILADAIPTSITVWTANDAVERDPASFTIFGTNSAASGAAGSSIGGLVQLATGTLTLPAGRNGSGATALLPANSATATFANLASYPTYVVVFPTVKNAGTANSMQIAEVQLNTASGAAVFSPNSSIVGGRVIPEPSTIAIALGSLVGLAIVRRRRK